MYSTDQTVPHQAAPTEPPAPASGDLAVLNQMLVTLVESRGSDLHLTVGTPPMIRVNGGLRPLPGYGNLNSSDTALLARAAVSPEIESLTIRRASSNEIREVALDQGMYDLRADGLAKAAGGLTSVREVSRVAI